MNFYIFLCRETFTWFLLFWDVEVKDQFEWNWHNRLRHVPGFIAGKNTLFKYTAFTIRDLIVTINVLLIGFTFFAECRQENLRRAMEGTTDRAHWRATPIKVVLCMYTITIMCTCRFYELSLNFNCCLWCLTWLSSMCPTFL